MKPRLQVSYESEVVPALMKRFSYKSVMQAPRITKIVVNMGCGDAIQDSKNLDAPSTKHDHTGGGIPLEENRNRSIHKYRTHSIPVEDVERGCCFSEGTTVFWLRCEIASLRP